VIFFPSVVVPVVFVIVTMIVTKTISTKFGRTLGCVKCQKSIVVRILMHVIVKIVRRKGIKGISR
jgi:hypothetical protein